MSIYAVSISLENCDRGHILPHLNVLMIILIARFKRMPFLFSPPWPPASCIICIDGASRRGLQQHQRLQSIMKFVVRHRGNNHPNKMLGPLWSPPHFNRKIISIPQLTLGPIIDSQTKIVDKRRTMTNDDSSTKQSDSSTKTSNSSANADPSTRKYDSSTTPKSDVPMLLQPKHAGRCNQSVMLLNMLPAGEVALL